MATYEQANIEDTRALVEDYRVDVAADIKKSGWPGGHVELALLDDRGRTMLHMNEEGAVYAVRELDYFPRGEEAVHASRVFAILSAGQRIGLAYRPIEAPPKQVTLHKGIGSLVLSNPTTEATNVIRLDLENTTELIPPGNLYTIEAGRTPDNTLVVSSLYHFATPAGLGTMEIPCKPGQQTIVTQDGVLTVPQQFFERYSLAA